jgi:hypothetical protein
MTKFIDTTKGSNEKTKTVFTHYLCGNNGWVETKRTIEYFEEVKYLGKCEIDGDMFACYYNNNSITIYKGTKGSEFD